jgi:hypothetical protein
MAGFINHRFGHLERYVIPFKPIKRTNEPRPVPRAYRWEQQLRSAERIAPEPEDLVAFRECHPDIKHPLMPDFITIWSVPVVSEAFRQIVVELEPDKHQFLSVALFDEAKEPLAGRYWVMNVLQTCDASIRAESVRQWHAMGHRVPELAAYSSVREDGSLGLRVGYFLDKAAIEGLHLWRPASPLSYAAGHDFYMSDLLLERIRRAKLRRLRVEPAAEISVDPLWEKA